MSTDGLPYSVYSSLDLAVRTAGGSPALAMALRSVIAESANRYLVIAEQWSGRGNGGPLSRQLLIDLGLAPLVQILDLREAFVLLNRVSILQTIALDLGLLAALYGDVMQIPVAATVTSRAWRVTEELSHLGRSLTSLGVNWIIGSVFEEAISGVTWDLGPVDRIQEEDLVRRDWIVSGDLSQSSSVYVTPGEKLRVLEPLVCRFDMTFAYRLLRSDADSPHWRLGRIDSSLGYRTMLSRRDLRVDAAHASGVSAGVTKE
jgi:hypothetical protein